MLAQGSVDPRTSQRISTSRAERHNIPSATNVHTQIKLVVIQLVLQLVVIQMDSTQFLIQAVKACSGRLNYVWAFNYE